MEEPDDLQPLDEEEEETEFATIAGGATIEEAKRTALDQLRKIVPYVNPADVDYLVVEEGSKGGFFGRGKSEARVEARLRPSDERVEADLPPGAEKLREFVQTVVDLMGVEAHVGASEAPDWVRAEIEKYRAEQGATILLASHNMGEVERLCDRVIMMRRGEIVDDGSPDMLLMRYGRENLEEVFLDIARGRRQAQENAQESVQETASGAAS